MTTAAESPYRATRRLDEALTLIEHIHRDPRTTRERAAALIEAHRSDEAACVALRALGLARKQLGEPTAARTALRAAVALGQRRGYVLRTAQARTSLLVILADTGRTQAALAEAALAESALAGLPNGSLDLARLRVNLGLVLQRTGRTAEALTCYSAAERTLRENGDARWEALMLNLRGTLLAYRGDLVATAQDLTRAATLARDNGYQGVHQTALHNLGFAALRAGDLPRALRVLDEARLLGEQLGKPTESVLADRADTLLAAGLADEARKSAEQAAEGHERSGFAFDAAEARLSAARAALSAGDAAAAAEHAHAARTAFTRQRRPGWAAWARHVEYAARFDAGERNARMLGDLVRNAARLEQAGWLVTPQESLLLAARTAAALGQAGTAHEIYARVAAARASGPAQRRVLGWTAEAELRASLGDTAGSGRAVDRGLRVVNEYAATLGATDMRVGAALLGQELAKAGLRLALDGGSARRLLERAEQWKAATLRRRPMRPPDDAQFADLLGRLRAVVAQIAADGVAGRGVSGLQTKLVQLEQRVKELARYAPGGEYAPEPALDIAALSSALGERALVEYVRLDDELHAVTLVDGRAARHRLGSYRTVLAELESLRFSLGRMARRYGSPAVQQAAVAAYDYARAELDDALLRPLSRRIGDRPLVLVPTGSLHALAWPVLPSLAGRAVNVAPSARAWLTAACAPGGAGAEGLSCRNALGDRVVLAYGPDLPHAQAEIAELARRYPLAKPLGGADATAGAVAAALDGAGLAHIAAHGRFRADNPLFSCLELADGPLTVYDLEGLKKAPETLVLSACDTALSGIRPGDELMGMASAVFALGTRTLIASVAPVDDAQARTLMRMFHQSFAGGAAPAAALAAAQSAVPAARGFVCFGAG